MIIVDCMHQWALHRAVNFSPIGFLYAHHISGLSGMGLVLLSIHPDCKSVCWP